MVLNLLMRWNLDCNHKWRSICLIIIRLNRNFSICMCVCVQYSKSIDLLSLSLKLSFQSLTILSLSLSFFLSYISFHVNGNMRSRIAVRSLSMSHVQLFALVLYVDGRRRRSSASRSFAPRRRCHPHEHANALCQFVVGLHR